MSISSKNVVSRITGAVVLGFALMCNAALAQVSIGIGYSDQPSELNDRQKERLQSMLLGLLSEGGSGGAGISENGLVCVPKAHFVRVDSVSNGMTLIHTVVIDLTLSVMHLIDGSVLSSGTKRISASGSSLARAVDNALGKISTSDSVLSKIISASRDRYVDMYTKKCAGIIKKAESYRLEKRIDEATALLMSVPAEAEECSEKAMKKIQEMYAAMADRECKTYILKARSSIANQQYESAMDYVASVDPLSSCYKEALAIAKEIENKVDESKRIAMQEARKERKDNFELEKKRIEAARDVAIEYCKSRLSTYNLILLK